MLTSVKATKFMTIETRSIKKKTTMGKSTTSLAPIVENPVQGIASQAQDLPVVVTPKATSTVRRET